MNLNENHTCKRRKELPSTSQWYDGVNEDTWRQVGDDHVCSFCGSMFWDEFLEFCKTIEDHPDHRLEPTTKKYKFYVHRDEIKNAGDGAIKFYTQHFPFEVVDGSYQVPIEIINIINNALDISKLRFQVKMIHLEKDMRNGKL